MNEGVGLSKFEGVCVERALKHPVLDCIGTHNKKCVFNSLSHELQILQVGELRIDSGGDKIQ